MYNGKYERNKSDMKQTVLRYLPLMFIVLISAIIVLFGYWLCLVSINFFKAMYEFFAENMDKLILSNEVILVLFVIGLLAAFAIVVKKSYFGEYSIYSEVEKVEKNTKEEQEHKKTGEPKMVRKTESAGSKQPNAKQKPHPVQCNKIDGNVSSNEVVWTNEEPSKRYGFKL